ncbi:MAG TPA: hypothetical protein VEV41_00980 [Terriglobales bacterium]|nr:hypothetical protein [Terriglobales bacterium]
MEYDLLLYDVTSTYFEGEAELLSWPMAGAISLLGSGRSCSVHKNKVRTITKMDDFNDELKESEVLTICRDGGIITKNIYNIMHAALGRRNAAAHPSSVIIDQLQTDAYIVDLITNVILQIA